MSRPTFYQEANCFGCKNRYKPLFKHQKYCSQKCAYPFRNNSYGIKPILLEESCNNCGTKANLTFNHKIPRAVRIDNSIENLETLCLRCNIKDYAELVNKALKHYFECKKN